MQMREYEKKMVFKLLCKSTTLTLYKFLIFYLNFPHSIFFYTYIFLSVSPACHVSLPQRRVNANTDLKEEIPFRTLFISTAAE